MTKGLFTNTEEISFNYNYVQGHVEKAYDPNAHRNPKEAKHIVSKKQSKKLVILRQKTR